MASEPSENSLLANLQSLYAAGDFVSLQDLLTGYVGPPIEPPKVAELILWDAAYQLNMQGLDRLNFLKASYLQQLPQYREHIEAIFRGDELPKESTRVLPSQLVTDNATTELENSEIESQLGAPLKIENFKIRRKISGGSFGVVYEASQISPPREVAVKVLQLRSLAAFNSRDLHREVNRIATLKHPNIIDVYNAGMAGQFPYFTMPIADGSLADRLSEFENDFDRIVKLVKMIAEALAYAHARGILHCDLKPGNILMFKDWPMLTDFGLSVIQSQKTNRELVGGTRGYMAPEQLTGDATQLTACTDVFGLGCVLYKLLTGEVPKVELTQLTAPSPSLINAAIPQDLAAICSKCIAYSVKERYASMEELIADLVRFQNNEPVSARPLTGILLPVRLAKWICRAPAKAAGVGILLIVMVALAVLSRKNLQLAELVNNIEKQRDYAAEVTFKTAEMEAKWISPTVAVEEYERCLALFELLSQGNPERSDYRFKLAQTKKNLGVMLQRIGDVQRARNMLDSAISEYVQLEQIKLDKQPEFDHLPDEHANACADLGNLWLKANDIEQAQAAFEEARKIRLQLAALTPDDLLRKHACVRSEIDLANCLAKLSGQTVAAVERFQLAIKSLNQMLDQPQATNDVFQSYQNSLNNLGVIFMQQGRHAESQQLFSDAVRRWRKLIDAEPGNLQYRQFYGAASCNLGIAEFNLSRVPEALRSLETAERILRECVEVDVVENTARSYLGHCLHEIANIRLALFQADGNEIHMKTAIEAASEAQRIFRGIVALGQDPAATLNLLIAYQRTAEILWIAGKNDEAHAHYRLANELLSQGEPALLAMRLQGLQLFNSYGRFLFELNEVGRAIEILSDGARAADELLREKCDRASVLNSAYKISDALGLCELVLSNSAEVNSEQIRRDRLARAEQHFLKAIELGREILSSISTRKAVFQEFVKIYARLGHVLEVRGEWKACEANYIEANRLLDRDPQAVQFGLMAARARALGGDPAGALELLRKHEVRVIEDATDHYNTACTLAQIATAVRSDSTVDKNADQRTQSLKQAALKHLMDAGRYGLFQNAVLREQIESDPDLVAIRDMPEFQEWLKESKAKALAQATPSTK